MLELYQFQHSTFCLKVRMVLQAKKMSYRTIEITPGIGQVNVFKLSGQRKVPLLKDGEHVVADSSAIIEYLENITKEPQLFPSEPQESTNAHIIEDGADTTLAKDIRSELLRAAAIDQLDALAKKINLAIVKQEMGSDPASVAFDTVQSAISNKSDYVFSFTKLREKYYVKKFDKDVNTISEPKIITQEDNENISFEDEYDLPKNLSIIKFPKLGPKIYPISLSMRETIKSFNADVLYLKGLWRQTSLEAYLWKKTNPNKILILCPAGMLQPTPLKNKKILTYRLKTQNLKYKNKNFPNNGEINWSWNGKKIYNFLRSMIHEPFPPPEIKIGNKAYYFVSKNLISSKKIINSPK